MSLRSSLSIFLLSFLSPSIFDGFNQLVSAIADALSTCITRRRIPCHIFVYESELGEHIAVLSSHLNNLLAAWWFIYISIVSRMEQMAN